ncbi:hypothetical protein Poly24_36460 [Rosistilla carotiformis]|uniref:Uncharacterized protein n=1 Tax=Rosistilla carotiformis TaxID=2528017 RepID=A0A518JWK7_9BACT|nr:DUF6655 family protein [Rosistilla carotiformis]QDV69928.1 hypothetical protein Poly24_36460 [Rosistilla carotiformis]
MPARLETYCRVATLTWALASSLLMGCGTTSSRTATDQLLLSDAVDRSITAIDFRPLTGRKVYLDATYVQPVKGLLFVNSDYIISSLRQQIIAAGCLLEDERKDAELIIEARVGTLGADGYQVIYGIPASNALSTAASLVAEAPPVPTIPELSFARRESNEASAKIAAFAYDRETRKAVWQSGISRSESDSRDTWVMGVGPFESGTVRDDTRLAGRNLPFHHDEETPHASNLRTPRPAVDLSDEIRFEDGYPIVPGAPPQPGVMAAGQEAVVLDATQGDELKTVSFEEAAKVSEESSEGKPPGDPPPKPKPKPK